MQRKYKLSAAGGWIIPIQPTTKNKQKNTQKIKIPFAYQN